MADIDIHRPHALGLDGARRAADRVADRLRAELGVDARWQGDVLHVTGRGVDGRIHASTDTVRVHARLGMLARPFRRPLVREIEQELDRLTGPPAIRPDVSPLSDCS